MRKSWIFVLVCVVLFPFSVVSQVPPYIPYQAIARDQAGQIKANTAIQVQFKIFNTMLSSASAYEEVHNTTTNDFGYFNLRIGNGTVQSGSFSAVTWSTGDVSYEIWIDIGSGFTQLGGRSGFMSVPYALYAGNAAPTPTLSINAPNTVTNTSTGTYTIHVPSPTLSINSNSLSISNGNTVQLPVSTTYTAGSGIAINSGSVINTAPNQTVNISGSSVSGSYPNYTISASPLPSLSAGNSNITVSGTSPDFTVSSTPSLSINSNSLSISNGNTIQLPVSPSYTAGSGIAINSGSITNTAPDQVVNITGALVSGTYPNYTVSASPSVSITSSNTLIAVTGTPPSYTLSALVPTLTATGNAYSTGAYPNQIITVDPEILSISGNTLSLSNGGGSVQLPTTSLAGTGLAGVTGTSGTYTVDVPIPSITYNSATGSYTYAQGTYTQNLNLSPQTTFTNNILSVGSSTAGVPVWNLSGNAGTNPATQFVGTTDANDLVVKTNGTDRLHITSTGSVGIGTVSPVAKLDVSGTSKLGVAGDVFTAMKYGTVSGSIALSLISSDVNATLNVPGAQVGDVLILMLNSYSGVSSTLSVNYASVSSANTITVNIHNSSLISLLVTANFSYILMRP